MFARSADAVPAPAVMAAACSCRRFCSSICKAVAFALVWFCRDVELAATIAAIDTPRAASASRLDHSRLRDRLGRDSSGCPLGSAAGGVDAPCCPVPSVVIRGQLPIPPGPRCSPNWSWRASGAQQENLRRPSLGSNDGVRRLRRLLSPSLRGAFGDPFGDRGLASGAASTAARMRPELHPLMAAATCGGGRSVSLGLGTTDGTTRGKCLGPCQGLLASTPSQKVGRPRLAPGQLRSECSCSRVVLCFRSEGLRQLLRGSGVRPGVW